MEDYNKLVEKNQTGEIDDLEFLLAQEDLAALYVADMQAEELARMRKTLLNGLKYENEHLYQ